jgi:hypothetical protein
VLFILDSTRVQKDQTKQNTIKRNYEINADTVEDLIVVYIRVLLVKLPKPLHLGEPLPCLHDHKKKLLRSRMVISACSPGSFEQSESES